MRAEERHERDSYWPSVANPQLNRRGLGTRFVLVSRPFDVRDTPKGRLPCPAWIALVSALLVVLMGIDNAPTEVAAHAGSNVVPLSAVRQVPESVFARPQVETDIGFTPGDELSSGGEATGQDARHGALVHLDSFREARLVDSPPAPGLAGFDEVLEVLDEDENRPMGRVVDIGNGDVGPTGVHRPQVSHTENVYAPHGGGRTTTGRTTAQRFTTYSPRTTFFHDPQVLADEVRGWFHLADPGFNASDRTRYVTLIEAAGCLDWISVAYGRPLGREAIDLFASHGVVEHYVNRKCKHLTSSAYPRLVRLSALASALRSQGYGHGEVAETALTDVAAKVRRSRRPYTPTELGRILDWIGSRPTPFSRAEARTIVGLSLGAGLTPGETMKLRARNVVTSGGAVHIDAPGDSRISPRVVRSSEPWSEYLAAHASGLSSGDYLVRRSSHRSGSGDADAISDFIKITSRSRPGGLRPRPQQLRLTWIVNQIESGVCSRQLRIDAGVRTLKDYKPVVVAAGVLTDDEFTAWHRKGPATEGR